MYVIFVWCIHTCVCVRVYLCACINMFVYIHAGGMYVTCVHTIYVWSVYFCMWTRKLHRYISCSMAHRSRCKHYLPFCPYRQDIWPPTPIITSDGNEYSPLNMYISLFYAGSCVCPCTHACAYIVLFLFVAGSVWTGSTFFFSKWLSTTLVFPSCQPLVSNRLSRFAVANLGEKTCGSLPYMEIACSG